MTMSTGAEKPTKLRPLRVVLAGSPSPIWKKGSPDPTRPPLMVAPLSPVIRKSLGGPAANILPRSLRSDGLI